MAHPSNAAFISKDGLVSFDEYGRKLDSLGNVVAEDYQTLRGASAAPNEAYWQRKLDEEMRRAGLMQEPAPSAAPPSAAAMAPGLAVGAPPTTGAPTGQAYNPLSSAPPPTAAPTERTMAPGPPANYVVGMGAPPTTGAPQQRRYDPLSSAAPGSLRTPANYVAGLNLPTPDNQRFDPPAGRPMPPAMGSPLPPAPQAKSGPLPSPYAPGAGEAGMPQIGSMGDNRRQNLMHVGGAAPAMPTRDQRIGQPQPMAAPSQPMGTPMPQRMAQPTPTPTGTPMPPARPPTWTPYQPYGVTAPLPGISREDEEAINQAVLWR